MIMGFTIMGSSLLSLGIFLPGHAGLIMGHDDESKQNFRSTLKLPDDTEAPDDTQGAADDDEP